MVGKKLKIGAFFLPNNITGGCLENLCIESVKTDNKDNTLDCINKYKLCAGIDDVGAAKKDKFILRLILSGLFPKEPDLALSKLLTRSRVDDIFDFSHQCFDPLLKFIKSVHK